MALIWNGREVGTETGTNRQAEDMEGNRVVVSATREVEDDFGWPKAWRSAERKYAEGRYEEIGDTRLVRITTNDIQGDD